MYSFFRKKKMNFSLPPKFGFNIFCIGISLLASAPAISIIFLVFASIIGTLNRKEKYLDDKYNYPFLLTTILLIISSISQTLNTKSIEGWDSSLSWIGLSNWLPLFWFFWGFQPYLSSSLKRTRIAFYLIAGTIPVIVSAIGQYFFKFYGPYKTLNGLIIWYMRPYDSGTGISGLFNNQNYTGAWMGMILPFLILFFLKNKSIFSRFISLTFLFIFSYVIFLTNSRGALISILFSLSLIKSINLILIIFMLGLLFISIILSPTFQYLPFDFKENIENIIPKKLLDKFSFSKAFEFKSYPRFEIWRKSIDFIFKYPLFGFGAGSFSIIYLMKGGIFNAQHPHNLFLQIAYNYGIPSALVLFISVIYIYFKSRQKETIELSISKDEIFNNPWRTSLLIFITLHLFDITYFDLRISILFWVILSANRCIIKNYE